MTPPTFPPSLMLVTCGHCGHRDDFDKFTASTISGTLPQGHYQCPACRLAWATVKGPRRYAHDIYPPLKVQAIQSVL